MSSTRKAKDDSIFHQARYASSPEFERGLIANLVAKRAEILADSADRELIWFIQHLSHQTGGLAALVKGIIANFTDRIQTAEMAIVNLKRGKVCDAALVKKLRGPFNRKFPLKGEKNEYFDEGSLLIEALLSHEKTEAELREERRIAQNHPASYSSDVFFEECIDAAESKLEKELCEICLNPAHSMTGGPWYFPQLIETLREYKAQCIEAKSAGVFTTALGKKVREVLDYTAYCRGLTLMQGEARLGKSHAARAWCERHPGQARFVEVPSGNDDVTFFRDLARGLGLGNFLNYKVVQIRERVESVLLTKTLVLVLDEAQRLWPQTNFREGYPKRIVWVMTMANAGVPIAMVSTPQFFVTQKVVEKNGWNSAQLTGRLCHYESLPADLSLDDLMAVAKSILPEASSESLRALAVYARSSARYLAAIDSIAKRARYIAMLDKRATATTGDVRKAMQESVIPADTKLHCALDRVGKERQRKTAPTPALPNPLHERTPDPEEGDILPSPSRLTAPAVGDRQREGNTASLIEA